MKLIYIKTGLVLALITATARAEDMQRIYRSAYLLGRGDSGLAIADNEDAIFYNPAGIALGKGLFKKAVFASPMVEGSTAIRDIATRAQSAQSSDDYINIARDNIGKPLHAGIYNFTGLIFRRAALGVVSSAQTDLLVYKAPQYGGLESAKADFVENNGATFSLAQDYLDQKLLVGSTFKYLQRGQAHIDVNMTDVDKVKNMKSGDVLGSGIGGGADVGLMWQNPKARVNPACGLTVMNVGQTRFKALNSNATNVDSLQQTVNFGCALRPGTKYSSFKLLADYWDATSTLTSNYRKKVHMGGEINVFNIVGFTAGMSQGAPSAGFFLNLYLLRFDLGMYTEEMEDRVGVRPDQRFFARLSVGF